METLDAIVLGAGGVGSAAMYYLARRGLRVLGIDQFRPPHDRGSSHGDTRVIRQAYFEHPDYVPLLGESYRLWRELESATGKRLLEQVGLVEIGPEEGIVVPGVLRAAAEHQLKVTPLSAAAVERRWPGLRVGTGLVGVYEPTAGYLRVEDCVEAHLDAAKAAGAQLAIQRAAGNVRDPWEIDGETISISVDGGQTLRAKRLIVTAGPWAGTLLADALPKLAVLRKSLFWFKTDRPEYNVANAMPVFLFELPGGIFYGFPSIDRQSVKIAEHTGGRVLESPDVVDRSVDPDEEIRLVEFLAAHLPGVTREVVRHATCLYTMSPDEHFIVDRHPQHSNIVFAAGLSGHGFKFAPVLGKALADLAVDGVTKLPIEFLSLKRVAV